MPAGLLTTIAFTGNTGDDLSGTVEEVGSAVTSVKPGDRVAASHQLGAPYGSYAEYALVKDFVCFKIPDGLDWEPAATFPMATYMASIALFGSLRLCSRPFEQLEGEQPLLVYGASSGVGSMVVKLAQVANIHPLICVAGGGADFVSGLIDQSKGDVVLNYKDGEKALIEGCKFVLGDRELEYAFDAVSEHHSLKKVIKVLKNDGGRIALTLPGRAHILPDSLQVTHVMAGSLWKKIEGLDKDAKLGNLGLEEGGPALARAMTNSIEKMLAQGDLRPHPFTVYASGLKGLEKALKDLREGKVSASRCVIRVADTSRP